jgi:type II secretion system protein H
MLRRGFTLIEMTVVIMILALLAAAIVPNAASAVISNRRRNFRLGVPRLVGEAHNKAVQTGQTVTMTKTENDGFQIATNDGQNDQAVDTLDGVDGVSIESVLDANGDQSNGEWQIAFYPDGTCEGGTIELGDNGATYRYQVTKSTSKVKLLGEGETDPSNDKWPAGELAVRGSSG